MGADAGAFVVAEDYSLPSASTATVGGANTITSTSFADLPTSNPTLAVTNSHLSKAMLVIVSYSAWMSASANSVWACIASTGGLTITPTPGGGGSAGYGEVLNCGQATPGLQQFAFITCELPANSTTTFKIQAKRTVAAGTQQCDQPTIRVVPVRFV